MPHIHPVGGTRIVYAYTVRVLSRYDTYRIENLIRQRMTCPAVSYRMRITYDTRIQTDSGPVGTGDWPCLFQSYEEIAKYIHNTYLRNMVHCLCRSDLDLEGCASLDSKDSRESGPST